MAAAPRAPPGIDSASTQCTSSAQCASGEICAFRRGALTGRCVAIWRGLYRGWVGAWMSLPEPRHAATVNGVTFKVTDVKALLALAYDASTSRFISLCCDRDITAVQHDAYGRPAGAPECADTNAGSFHIVLTDEVGVGRRSFAIDRDFAGPVQMEPVRGYRVVTQEAVSPRAANALIGVPVVVRQSFPIAGSVITGQWLRYGPI